MSVKEHELPDYLNNLNAIHEAIKNLKINHGEFGKYLTKVVTKIDFNEKQLTLCANWWVIERIANATAIQRADAFLMAIGFNNL